MEERGNMSISAADYNRVALFDLDGSLADYDLAMRRDLLSLRAPDEPPITVGTNLHELEDRYPHIKERMDLIKSKPGWWLTLPRIEMGFVIVSLAREMGYGLNVLTKAPRNHTKAWTEKVEWCKGQPELATADIHLTMNKGLVYGTFLYDDYPVYMDLWLANRPRGLGIMLATPDNAAYKHPNVVKWDGTNLEKVTQALQAAYDRAPREALVLT
jgi:5'-nucleotidase